MTLAEKHCTPCQMGGEALSPDSAQTLLKNLADWQLVEAAKKLQKTYKFKNFIQALEFVNKVGATAETEKHHPDISFGWGYVTIEIYTHKIGGLHENDFILAAKIDKLQ